MECLCDMMLHEHHDNMYHVHYTELAEADELLRQVQRQVKGKIQ